MTSRTQYLLLVSMLIAVPACVEDAPELGDASAELGVAKVTICHVPPGNPANAHTITVGAPAVRAHLAHGDALGACAPVCVPVPEVCGDGLDNDCDGAIDDGCCVATAEVCDGVDNDCNGLVDDTAAGCVCTPGASESCYDGAAGTAGVGVCTAGVRTCSADGSAWGACTGEVTPTADACGDGVDSDCDGTTDEGAPEICDGIDNDCDGAIDEGCLGDLVWMDEIPPLTPTSDGLQEATEAGIGGITIALRDATTGALVAVAVSDAGGAYHFTGVPAGNYYLQADVPGEYNLAPQDALGDTADQLDSDFGWDENGNAVTAPFAYDGNARGDLDLGLTVTST